MVEPFGDRNCFFQSKDEVILNTQKLYSLVIVACSVPPPKKKNILYIYIRMYI